MRISDFIRSQEEVIAKPPIPIQKPAVRTPLKPANREPAPAMPSLDQVEKKIREQVESKFSAELDRIRQKMEQEFQGRVAAEQAHLKAREEELQKKELEQKSLLQTSVNQQAALDRERKAQESEWQRRMEEEKRVFQRKFEEEMGKAKDLIQSLEAKLTQKAPVAEKTILSEPKTVDPVPPKEEIQEIIPASASKIEPSKIVIPTHEHSIQEAKQVFEQPDPEILNLEWDVSRLDEIRAIRDTLLEMLARFFESVERGEAPSTNEARGIFHQLIQAIHGRDYEAIRVALEPYSAGARFLGHGVNVAFLSIVLGREFQLLESDLIELGLAALLHDIGLSKVKEDLNYPKQLSPKMEKEILDHPNRGAQLLKGQLGEAAIAGIQQHHEVGTGKGYPNGLEEADIHLYARIIHIADSFEALVHERPYRPKPLEVHEAVKELIDAGRDVYDREVLKAVLMRIGLYPVMTEVELSNKQFGIVVKQNRNFPLSPIVRAELDENHQPLARPFLIDLSKTQFIHIVGTVHKGSDEFPSSRFNPVDSAAHSGRRREILDFAQGFLSIVMILTLVLVIFYVIIKI